MQMIARIWHGVTMADKAGAFYRFVRKSGEQAYLKSPGNRGVRILRRRFDDKAEFLLISFWDSIESIKRFAGEDFNKAIYPFPEDKDFLLELEPEVKHFEVLK
jgi:heme-degrading monooxygenase HmoA